MSGNEDATKSIIRRRQLIEVARDLYATDEVEIDNDEDDERCFSPGEDGTWVRAWVWVPLTEFHERARDRDVEGDYVGYLEQRITERAERKGGK